MHHSHFGRHRGGHHAHGSDRRQAHGGRRPGDHWPGDEHGHGPRRGHGGGRDGRIGRLFAHGDLHFVILHLAGEKPRHGYEVIKAIEEMAGGTYTPSPGTIYPALTMLEEQGYVAAETCAGNKKLYRITTEGQDYLNANSTAVDTLLARVRQAGAARAETSPRVVRAVENLKMALHLRMSRGELSEQQAQIVAEALDRAATEIENC